MKLLRTFTTTSEQRNKKSFLFRGSNVGVNALRAFTLMELIIVVAIIGLLASIVLATLTDAQRDARDKRRIQDVRQLEAALQLYYTRNNSYPTEASGANGNVFTNTIFKNAIAEYMRGTPTDPIPASDTFYYYYDGRHNCGGRNYAVIFARQMEKPVNSNYNDFLNTTCTGVLDGEGRGGGTSSYNLIIGTSGG